MNRVVYSKRKDVLIYKKKEKEKILNIKNEEYIYK